MFRLHYLELPFFFLEWWGGGEGEGEGGGGEFWGQPNLEILVRELRVTRNEWLKPKNSKSK